MLFPKKAAAFKQTEEAIDLHPQTPHHPLLPQCAEA
jgi:hypothetical protein